MSNLKLNLTTSKELAKQEQLVVYYGFTDTKFGKCLLGFIQNALCYLSFYDNDENEALNKLKSTHPKATFVPDQETVTDVIESIFQNDERHLLNICLTGTDFQIKVWKALTKIEPGCTKSYEDIAHAIEQPTSVRAVANAIAHNNIAYVIPCHRVILKNGKMTHKSRWGLDRKQKMLKHEGVMLEI